MKFQVGDKVQVVKGCEEDIGDDRSNNGVYPKKGVVLAIDSDEANCLIGVTDPPHFLGHNGDENERQKLNWHEKCWWIYNIHLLKVV